jgi:hypothetical protein
MSLFVVWEGRLIPVERDVVESDRSFVRRIEFFLHALDQGVSAERSSVLSHCYLNQLLYGSRYMAAIEAQIRAIDPQPTPTHQ